MKTLESGQQVAMYAAMLSVKGRVLYDCIVCKPEVSEEGEYWLDVASKDAESIKKHLKRYGMRKHVKVEAMGSIGVFCVKEMGKGGMYVEEMSYLTDGVIE